MAEIAVGLVVDHFIPLLAQEGSLLTGVHSHALDIKRELLSIQCLLKDADRRAEAEENDTSRSDGAKVWVEQVRDLAFRIEDVIDDYTFYLTKHPFRDGLVGFFHKIGRAIYLIPRYNIASQIHDIESTVCGIKDRSARYGFDSIDYRRWPYIRPSVYRFLDPYFLKEDEVVDVESDREKLFRWLADESPNCKIFALVGMGGLGKTTLAKRVYDSVKSRFNCHAWITISQSYDGNEVLQSLMDKFDIEGMLSSASGADVQIQMISKIREFLKNKRYVIVFDDVWSDNLWIDIKHALFDTAGRIIVTTRNRDVLCSCELALQSRVCVHQLQPLPREKAWQLFCLKASGCILGDEIQNCARQIVPRCEGLPLAIVTIAGLLSAKETVEEWRELHDNLRFELERNPQLTSIMRILSLSYYELPHHLKPCLLYLGLYPEGYSINCHRLIRQWISECFITPVLWSSRTVEQIAQDYLGELINRSLVQKSRVNFRGEVKECRIHSLVHEMILKKARHLQFGNYISQCAGSFAEPGRRLSVGNTSLDALGTMKHSRVRAILIFNKLHEIPSSLETQFIANFKYLKVLDFEYASLTALPKGLGTLFHLRYLSVAHTKVRKLPMSIGKLQNLETLDLRWSLVHEVPVEIKRLHKLQHLSAYRIDTKTDNFHAREGGINLKKGVGSLTSLQTLCYIESNNKILAELSKLTQLRKLGVMNLTTADGRNLCLCTCGMTTLKSLRVSTRSDDDIIYLDDSFYPCYLHSLILKGRLNRFPEWIGRLETLTRLEIVGSRLNHDPATVIHPLSKLVVLKYGDNSYDGERLGFVEGIFPKLKYLYLQHLSRLNSLVIDQGAMPNLEELSIEDCRQLKDVPAGLQHLRNLKKISLVDMPEEFARSMKPGGRHWKTIRDVSEVVWVREVYDMPTEASTSGSH